MHIQPIEVSASHACERNEMMKKILIVTCCLMRCVAVAQEKITSFKGRSYETPNGVQKLDTINGKLIFSIRRPESDWIKLWTTDGKPENTHLLKDEDGNVVDGTPWLAKAYGYIYMNFPYTGLYRTKGDFLEKVRGKPDSLQSINSFNGKLLVLFASIDNAGNARVGYSHLDFLNANNTITRLADNVLLSQIIDSTLHYVTADYATGNFELCKLDKNGRMKKNLIDRKGDKITIYSFRYYSVRGYDFYFFETSKGTKLVSKPQNSDEAVSLVDWGEYSYFPDKVQDTSGQVYFLRKSGQLKLFALQNDYTLQEKWTIALELIDKQNISVSGKIARYGSFNIIGNKLVFAAGIGDWEVVGLFLNIYDLDKMVNLRSKNILPQLGNAYLPIKFTELDTDIYRIDNLAGTRFTYNFRIDSLTNKENYPYENPQLKDSLLIINQETLLLKNNIYNITKGNKTPLIPTRQIFEEYDTHYFTYKVLGDRMIFMNYNSSTKLNEVWVSKGEKNDAQLLAELPGDFSYMGNTMQEKNGKLYFYVRNPESGMIFYETDGTRAGTLKVIEIVDPKNIDHYQSGHNDKSVVFGLRNADSKGTLLVIENGNKRLLNFRVEGHYDIYLTNNDIYLMVRQDKARDLYKVVGNEAILIETNIQEVTIYQDYVLYSKIVDSQGDRYGLFTVDKADKSIRFISHNISSYSIVDNRLIYTYRVNQGLVTSVFDLVTARLEIDKMIGTYDNGKIYLNDVLIMVRDAQAVFIRGSNVRTFDIGFPASNGMVPFARGVLFLGQNDILYYDMAADKTEQVLKGKPFSYKPDEFSKESLEKRAYFFIWVDTGNAKYRWAYWAPGEKQLNYLDEKIFRFTTLGPTWAVSTSTDNKWSYWYYNGGRLIEKYPLPMLSYDNSILQANGAAFAFFKTPEKGNELYQFGPDSLIAYPEIIPGPEGMEAKHLFAFNKQIYVYGFTYTYGWQVWKIGEPRTFITSTESPQEPVAAHLSIFPNPTQDWLYSNTEKTLPYRFLNIKGQVLMQGNMAPQQGINMQQLPQGVYLIQLFDEGKVFVRKVVKE
jgi:hypothetical protein